MPTKQRLSYAEKLKDPRWQRKRLEILEMDEFTCVSCGATDRTLHVHHGVYIRGAEPWEAPDETLWTLCEDCHEDCGNEMRRLQREIGETPPDSYAGIRRAVRNLAATGQLPAAGDAVSLYKAAAAYYGLDKSELNRIVEKVHGDLNLINVLFRIRDYILLMNE